MDFEMFENPTVEVGSDLAVDRGLLTLAAGEVDRFAELPESGLSGSTNKFLIQGPCSCGRKL